MASNKNRNGKVVQFMLTDDDYKAFGRYRIMYTEQGHKMVRRQRLTFILAGIGISVLFTVFHVDKSFTYLMYVLSAACILAGLLFGEKMVLKQQEQVIEKSRNDIERIHPKMNKVIFGEESFLTVTEGEEHEYLYKDIMLFDFTEEGFYVWMSDTAIMPIPAHAFRSMDEMKEFNKWLKDRIAAAGGSASGAVM